MRKTKTRSTSRPAIRLFTAVLPGHLAAQLRYYPRLESVWNDLMPSRRDSYITYITDGQTAAEQQERFDLVLKLLVGLAHRPSFSQS